LHLRPLLHDNPLELEATRCPPLVQQLILGKAAQAEVLPPARLVLPAVELHHVGQREPRLLFVGPVVRIGGYIRQEPVA